MSEKFSFLDSVYSFALDHHRKTWKNPCELPIGSVPPEADITYNLTTESGKF